MNGIILASSKNQADKNQFFGRQPWQDGYLNRYHHITSRMNASQSALSSYQDTGLHSTLRQGQPEDLLPL